MKFCSVQMTMVGRAITCALLLFSPFVYGRGDTLERPASNFKSSGAGLTETLLKFAHEEHLPIAIEYVDRASMDRPIEVNLRDKTIRQGLDSLLLNGNGYQWRFRNGLVEITNKRGSKHAESLWNKVIPVFTIAEGETVQMSSTMLWWQLQIALDPSIKGIDGDIMGRSSAVKSGTLHNREIGEILAYIVLNSQAEAWVAAGPPECLGYTPHCGLWYIVEKEPSGNSSQSVLKKVRGNL